MNINYAHLCEKAFLSQNGNLNIIGIFEKIAGQQFPMVFPQLSIVVSLEGELGQHNLGIRIVNVKTQKEVAKPIAIQLNVEPNKDQPDAKPNDLRIMGDINNLTLEEAGKYEVQISLDAKDVYTIPFAAEKITKPIPEGR